MKHYKVYMHVFPDGRRYVGVTSQTIQERINCGYQHNEKIKAAAKQYGWKNVRSKVLEDSLTQEEAFLKEQEYIRLVRERYGSLCLNISNGGKSTFEGLKHTDSHKRHMSQMYKGKVFSENTLKRMRESHKSQCKPVNRIDLNGNVIKTYKSLGDAAEDVKGYKSNISRACNEGKAYKGSMWSFAKGVM